MNRQKQIAKLVYAVFPEESIERQALVIVYEVGDLMRCIQRMGCTRSNTEYRAYRVEAKKAIADLITQLRLSCEKLGFSFEELDDFGFEALKEKMKERQNGSRKYTR